MSFDVLATAAMVSEFRHTILGGRVQDVVLVDSLSIGLEIYAYAQRQYVYATADAQRARVQQVEFKLRRGPDTQTAMWQLLRKFVRGAHLVEVDQPDLDRIVRLAFQSEEGLVHLYVEVMGRHSNIILVDAEGQVMDSVKRVTPQMSHRVILPRHAYAPPPPQHKTSYASLTPGQLRRALQEQGAGGLLWRKLVAVILGMSPLLAREVVYRVTGDALAQEADEERLLAEIDSLMGRAREDDWAPSLGWEEGQIVAYAPYPLAQFAQREEVATLSEAISRYEERGAAVADDGYVVARARWQAAIDHKRRQIMRRQASLQRSLASQAEREAVMQKGQMILASSYGIEPGQTELIVDWGDGNPVRIELDPTCSPSENAQRYFREYVKMKAAADQIPELLAQIQRELAYADQLETDLMLASNRAEIDQVRETLVEAGYVRTPSRSTRAAPSSPGRYRSSDGWTIMVGRNSHQNEALTFDRAKPHDLWLHVRNTPGSHVIVATEGRDVPPATLQEAAELAAYHSKARLDGAVDVAYLPCRQVKRMRGAGPGMVTYQRSETIRVQPNEHRSLRVG